MLLCLDLKLFKYSSGDFGVSFGVLVSQAVRSATLDLSYMSPVINHGDAVAELCQSGNGT